MDYAILKNNQEDDNWVEVVDFKTEVEKNGYDYTKELEDEFIMMLKMQGEISLRFFSYKIKGAVRTDAYIRDNIKEPTVFKLFTLYEYKNNEIIELKDARRAGNIRNLLTKKNIDINCLDFEPFFIIGKCKNFKLHRFNTQSFVDSYNSGFLKDER